MHYRSAVPALALLVAFTAACTREARVPMSPERLLLSVDSTQGGGEGELLGALYLNGAAITDSGYTVDLLAADPATLNRLHFYSGSMWVSPGGHNGQGYMFAWIDPRHQGHCGTEYQYVSGDTIDRGVEVHWPTRTTPPSGKEKHCIQPGTYWLTIYHNVGIYKQFLVDYVPEMRAENAFLWIYDATALVSEGIEKQNWDDTSYEHHDLHVRIDVGTPGYSDTPVLYADSAGANPYANTTFTDAPSLSGTHHTWFRVSSVASTSSEPSQPQGRLLSRVYWDSAGNLQDNTGFWDSHSNEGVIRIHQFMSDTLTTRNYVVGLETMRPDEQPRTTPEVTRIIAIQAPPPPPPPPFDSVHVSGSLSVKPNQTCEWDLLTYGGVSPFNYTWYVKQGIKWILVGSDVALNLAVGTSNLTLRGQATDSTNTSRTQTVNVTVASSGTTCYLRPIRHGP